MITPNTIIVLYSLSCVYNGIIYSGLLDKYPEINQRLLILFYVLLGPITTTKLFYWQAEAWIEVRKFRRYLRSPRFAADLLKGCNELGIKIEGGNTKENTERMTRENAKDIPF